MLYCLAVSEVCDPGCLWQVGWIDRGNQNEDSSRICDEVVPTDYKQPATTLMTIGQKLKNLWWIVHPGKLGKDGKSMPGM